MNLIAELNRLWEPVRPYLAEQVEEICGRRGATVLEVGPFSGLALELARRDAKMSVHMAVFPGEITDGLRDEARRLGLEGRVMVAESDDRLSGVPENTFDLIIFRGVFFFPSFFTPDLQGVYRSMKTGGVALLGGGFGYHTPGEIIRSVEKRSKNLNQAVGRVRIAEGDLWSIIEAAGLKERATMITEGGLWIVLRK
jgi:hypothetical protein